MENLKTILVVLIASSFILFSCGGDKPFKTKADCNTKDQKEAYQFGEDVRTWVDLTGKGSLSLSSAIVEYSESMEMGWLAELYKADNECVQAGYEGDSKE